MSVTTLQRRPLAPVELDQPGEPWEPPLAPLAPAPVRARRRAHRRVVAELPPREAPSPRQRGAVRYTRRGKAVLVTAMLSSVVSAAVIAHPTRAPGSGRPASVVVQPGDTLWTIAGAVDDRADPRATVERIVELNRLPGVAIHPGQRLRIPAR